MELHIARPEGQNVVEGRIVEMTYLGGGTQVKMATPAGTTLALMVPTAKLSSGMTQGSTVWMSWQATDGMFI